MALDQTSTAEAIVAPLDQLVGDPLMVPLAVVVLNVLADDSPKMALTVRDHPADAL